MIDKTRSSIEEDFSLEEQNFQSVIDMETEDDYSRGNQLLYTNALVRTTGPTDTTLLSAGNYFIEEILIVIGYVQLTGTATLGVSGFYTFELTDGGSNVYYTYTFAETVFNLPGVFPNIVTVTIPINLPFRQGIEAILPRASPIILHETALTSFLQIIYSINIYGRILP